MSSDEVGVDYDDVVATLEQEGVEKFSPRSPTLLEGVRDQAGCLGHEGC